MRDCGRLGGVWQGWEGLGVGKAGRDLWKTRRDCGRLKMLREGRGKAVRDRERLEESGKA